MGPFPYNTAKTLPNGEPERGCDMDHGRINALFSLSITIGSGGSIDYADDALLTFGDDDDFSFAYYSATDDFRLKTGSTNLVEFNKTGELVYVHGAATINGILTATAFTIGANSLTTTEWGNLDGQDQAVKTTSSPTFNALTVTSIAIGANTLTTSEFGYLDGQDQAVKTTSSPTFAGITATSITMGGVVLTGSEWFYLDEQDQTVNTGSSPTFVSPKVTTIEISGYVLSSSEFSFLDGINQSVATTSSPTFNALTVTSIIIGANTVTTSEWANLDGLNQTVATTSSPTFNAITATSLIIGANTITTSEWAFLDGLNQAVNTTSSPTHADLTLTGGDLIASTATTFNVFNTVATTVNFAGAATTLNIGAATGTATIANATTSITGSLAVGQATALSKLHVKGTELTTGVITGTSHGLAKLMGGTYSANDVLALDFSTSDYTSALVRVAAVLTNSGSYLKFGTTNDYSLGITNTAMSIDYNGDVVITSDLTCDELTLTTGLYDYKFTSPSLGKLDVENQSAGQAAVFEVKAKDDDGTDSVYFRARRDSTNGMLIGWDAGKYNLLCTGTTLDLFISTTGNYLIGASAAGTTAVGVVALANGTAPTTSPANLIQFWSDSGELKVRDASSNVTTLSPHNFSKIPEGVSEDGAWAYYSEFGPDDNRQYINADITKALRDLEHLTGRTYIYKGQLAVA